MFLLLYLYDRVVNVVYFLIKVTIRIIAKKILRVWM